MRVIILGSGAGGGVPQWNCRCPVCRLAWDEPARVRPRTQTGVAVSGDGERYVLLDAAPDLRQQIIATPALHPRHAGRCSPIAAVVLTSAEVDHVAGLLCLREGHAFAIHATRPVLDLMAQSAMFDVLRPERVGRETIVLDRPASVCGLTVTAFAVPGKVPLYREDERVLVGEATEDVVGLMVSDGRRRLAYVPGVAHLPPALRARLAAADLLLLDGTTFTDDELVAAGLSGKTAGRMGHIAMTGPEGSLAAFAAPGLSRRMFIHLNNTNPVLIEDSAERAAVVAAGWTVAHDGMELAL